MEKIRLVLLVEDEYRDALRAEAAEAGEDMSETFKRLVETHLAEALKRIRARRSQDAAPKKKGKPTKGDE